MDSVKFPLQTLQDRRGTSSDLSALYISLLESIGVQTAFISAPGHVYVAFALASSEEETRKTCGYSDELLFREGKAWVPVEVTEPQGSFLTAWRAGLEQWRKARKQAHFYPVPAARNAESPTVSVGGEPPLPDLGQLASSFQEEVRCLVAREIHDREAQLTAAVTSSNRSTRTLNALGLLYARCDILEKAEAQFQAAVERLEYAPALVNLGNLRLLAGVPEEALGFYQRAAAVAPDDPAVLLGLARSNFQLHNRWLAKEQHRKLQMRNHEAGRAVLLSFTVGGVGQAGCRGQPDERRHGVGGREMKQATLVAGSASMRAKTKRISTSILRTIARKGDHVCRRIH